jgi:hypothetical protein
MPAHGHTVELITTKEIDLFLPIMRELAADFGDPFLLSMLHWWGFGSRLAPLEFWQVFLIRSWAYPGSIDDPNRRRICAGWDGSLFVQNFDAKALEAPRFTQRRLCVGTGLQRALGLHRVL